MALGIRVYNTPNFVPGGLLDMRFPYALLVLFMIIPVAAKPGRTGYDWFLSSTDYHAGLNTDNNSAPDARDEHGIKEVIPKEFQTRYQK